MRLSEYSARLAADVIVPDSVVLDELRRRMEDVQPVPAPVYAVAAPPVDVDLSRNLRYIRCQGGEGCWGYSLLAIWDIMNEMACPYSPNLSLNLGLFLHRRRDFWEAKGGINSPDGRFHKAVGTQWLEQSFGWTTEGTELTHPSTRWTGGWTDEGINEANNYRLASGAKKITVSSVDFMQWLASGRPIQLEDDGHVIAVIGYNATNKTFRFVNSYGDRWGDNGFSNYRFNQIDNKQGIWGALGNAYIIEIVPPRPVPAARIWFKHTNRMDVNLWLSVENSPHPKRKIWPTHDWGDNSRNLYYTVRIPSEFIWPPSTGNRLILDLYDSAQFSETGGRVEEFTVAFGKHVLICPQLASGPVTFGPREHKRFSIP